MKPYNVKGSCGLCGRPIVIVPDEAPHHRAPEKAFGSEPTAHECPPPEVLEEERKARDAKHEETVKTAAEKLAAEAEKADAAEAAADLEAEHAARAAAKEHDEAHGQLA